jgi:prevent-host-death family protein
MRFLSMTEIGAFEAKNTLGTLLDRVERGEEIIITRHGKAVARLVPNNRRVDQNQAQAAFDRIRQRAQRLHKKKHAAFGWPALKQLRDQGRP